MHFLKGSLTQWRLLWKSQMACAQFPHLRMGTTTGAYVCVLTHARVGA